MVEIYLLSLLGITAIFGVCELARTDGRDKTGGHHHHTLPGGDDIAGFIGTDILHRTAGNGETATGGTGEDPIVLLDGEDVDPATLTDLDMANDALIYVYDHNQPEPVLELTENDDGSQTLTADAVVVAVVSSAVLTVNDVFLYQRPGDPGQIV